ncbi:MAG: MarR family winged helix-turn-helix transcriptional regulator [Hyphomicrobiaceae bacterium]
MTDVNPARAPTGRSAPGGQDKTSAETVNDQQLVALVELLFFAYRDFVGEPDALLADLGFGRAHHRVLHFVNINPGLRVADLLQKLKITKQSLSRVLKQLVDLDYVVQETGSVDRRERRLHLTDKGRTLADHLLTLQKRRLAKALDAAGPDSVKTAALFLASVIEATDRPTAQELIDRALGAKRKPARKRSPERV